MNSSSLSAARTPFIRLLVPLLAGILYQEFLCPPIWGNLIPALCGFSFMEFIHKTRQYRRTIPQTKYFRSRIIPYRLFYRSDTAWHSKPHIPTAFRFLSYRDSSRKRQSHRKKELLLLSRYDNSPVGYKRVDREI